MRRVIGSALALVFAIAIAVSCAPGTTNPTPSSVSTGQGSGDAIPHRLVTAPDLAKALEQKDFVLVNVHVPYAGEIEGTDLFIPYDQVEASLAKLPSDKGAKIVLYCRSGSMSAIAARTLVGLGYTNVSDLQGGMGSWTAAGYQVLERPQ
jgi:rhodanese-related sulfurtransferase